MSILDVPPTKPVLHAPIPSKVSPRKGGKKVPRAVYMTLSEGGVRMVHPHTYYFAYQAGNSLEI